MGISRENFVGSIVNIAEQAMPTGVQKYMIIAENTVSRLLTNHRFFVEQIEKNELMMAEIYESIGKLQIVNIMLDRAVDDAQAIFESLNSTGKELSELDLIRNYILMGLKNDEQSYVYEHLWRPMELMFEYEKPDSVTAATFMQTGRQTADEQYQLIMV